jgi:hypothetical protein
VSFSKDITTLAITKMRGGVCTAGIDDAGLWVRPVRPAPEQPWRTSGATDHSLLPIDFFHGGKSHLVNLAVTRLYLTKQAPDPPHVEDWIIDPRKKPELLRKLSPAEQQDFLSSHAESGISRLLPAHTASLCLVRPHRFSFLFRVAPTGDDVSVRSSFYAAGDEIRDIACTDLRMRALGRSLLVGKSYEAEFTLSDEDFRRRGKAETYLAVGLSRLYQGKHWPLIVGVHSIPELDVEIDYGRL